MLLTNEELRKRIARNGRKLIETHHSITVRKERLQKYLNYIISKNEYKIRSEKGLSLSWLIFTMLISIIVLTLRKLSKLIDNPEKNLIKHISAITIDP